MSVFFSPDGNPEVWDEKPDGYFTPEEWAQAHPDIPIVPDPPTEEELYDAERAAVEAKYSAPWNGGGGGILTLLQMTIIAALASGQDTAGLYAQYNTELTNMNSEFETIDEKYGVA